MKCCHCGGEIVYGEPHVMWVKDDHGERDTYWCEDCIDEYAEACWPEDWGPRQSKINRSAKAGRA
jgi:hypothetical protein